MDNLIKVYEMGLLSKKTRATIIIKLGEAINYAHANNVTEPIVYELVKILDPDNEILNNPRYKNTQ